MPSLDSGSKPRGVLKAAALWVGGIWAVSIWAFCVEYPHLGILGALFMVPSYFLVRLARPADAPMSAFVAAACLVFLVGEGIGAGDDDLRYLYLSVPVAACIISALWTRARRRRATG